MDHLVGTAEIAQRLGARHAELVHDWRRRYPSDSDDPFPQPLTRLKIGLVFYWPEIERWAKKTGRITRRTGPDVAENRP